MSRYLRSGLVALALLLSLLIGPAVAGAAPAPGPGNSPNAKACQKGGYAKYTRSDGTTFANQDECVSYAAQGGELALLSPCFAEAVRAGVLPPGANPGNTNFVAGTEGNDNFTGRATPDPDVFCGFGGNDSIYTTLDAGDLFLGGDGDDSVDQLHGGTFNGGAGNDRVNTLQDGTFNGGDGIDVVSFQTGGTFNGGAGNDYVGVLIGGTFNGGDGDDNFGSRTNGTFNED